MASSSSLSFTDKWKYDVFLSFRGIDTRSGFTGSLHRALRGKEIKSFMDDKDLEKGAEINPALDEAIQSSRIALVVLSKNYASSTFCLDELGKIMECSKHKGMLVLPVFYEVEPSDVRYQKGKYADALIKHEARIIEKEKIEKWRVALTKISHLSGWHFKRDRYEYELIDIIVQDIIKKIHRFCDGEKEKIIVKGYDCVAAYLSENVLVEQFNGMSLARNISGSLETNTTDPLKSENLTEDQLYMKDTLAAYRIAVEAAAAARIEAAFREPSLKVRSQVIEFLSPEDEARHIVASMKIQHAFRNFESRKMMVAAARIQHRFRAWMIRREFLHMRRQAIKIQAAFRVFQVRRQLRKIIWSVGVLEKAIRRWRLKRKGFRALQVNPVQEINDDKQESDTDEDFFRTGRKQAEERVERSVVRVQAMFRSKKAQEENRRVELAHNQAEDEARHIVAAMKIQHAFRNFKSRKIVRKTRRWKRKCRKQNRGEEQLVWSQENVLQTGIPDSKMKQIEYGAAAAWIQHRFRTWKLRREFLRMQRQAIKIQAAFRGFQMRRKYGKIIWSVGVLEKAILRWHLKRKGFRGLQVNPVQEIKDDKQESDAAEDFFRTGRKQAQERVERSVIRVQATFRSKKAQEEYRRMKLAHSQAEMTNIYKCYCHYLISHVYLLVQLPCAAGA